MNIPAIHILGTSKGGRPTNTEHHLGKIQDTHPKLTSWQINRAVSNAKALEALLKSSPADSHLALAPFYNVHGKGVRDTMKMIAENYTRLRLLHTSRLSVDYILAYRKGGNLQNMRHVVTHTQAILQTKAGWATHGLQQNLAKIGDENTAAGLDFLLSADPRNDTTIAISTPWQWRDGDSEFLERINQFGPENNHTYFGLFGLNGSAIGIPLQESGENPEKIQFGVIELTDAPGSLAHALRSISAEGKHIHSIMSFPQDSGKVLFVIAYNEGTGDSESSVACGNGSISETYDENTQVVPYKYRLSIPNARGSLGRALGSISHLINIRSIESIGTSRENADFEIIIAEQSSTTEDTLSYLEEILTRLDFYPQSSHAEEPDHILHTLRN